MAEPAPREVPELLVGDRGVVVDSVPFSDAAAAFAIVLTLVWAVVAAALWGSFIRHSRHAAAPAPPARRADRPGSAGFPGSAGILPAELGERGAVTTTTADLPGDRVVRTESLSTNGVEVLRTTTTSILGGATSTTRQWVDVATAPSPSRDNEALSPHPASAVWTTTSTLTTYLPNGHRVETVVTTASDAPAVTNSVSTYDLLGRLLSTATPGANGAAVATSYAYDGTSSRVLASSTVADGLAPRETVFLYNDFGEQVGSVLDGVTNRTDTTYETDPSNIVWRVATSVTEGPSTNACTVVRERLSGLGDACREFMESSDISGRSSSRHAFVDPDAGMRLEVEWSSDAGMTTNAMSFGLPVEIHAPSGTTFNEYDALGRVASVSRSQILPGETSRSVVPVAEFEYDGAGEIVRRRVFTNELDSVSETFSFDALGNRVSTTDALGNTIRRSFDPRRNVVSEDGATYPVRCTYDSQNRLTSLSTTRDGETWDTTTWAYDHATGNCLSKTYADGSSVSYTYAPDNLPLRTTQASGKWTENVYDAHRRRIGVLSSDEGGDTAFALDVFGRVCSASNSASAVAIAYSCGNSATNETWGVGGETANIRRIFDGQGRMSRLSITGSGHDVSYSFAADGQLEAVSNAAFSVTYNYTSDRRDAGHAIALSSGKSFVRSVERDPFRRELVASIANAVDGLSIDGLLYGNDALGRPVSRNADTFGYNARGEVISSRRAAENAEDSYSYDDIGNLTRFSSDATTNAYMANCLNQYTAISNLCASAPLREPLYDADGNLLFDGVFRYSYDAENRLVAVRSASLTNGAVRVLNSYDHNDRRVRKTVQRLMLPESVPPAPPQSAEWTTIATHTYFYDDWNLIEERIARDDGTASTNRYIWGKDLSGSLQSAGGVGGLVAVSRNGLHYFPSYDNNGNVTQYLDESGTVVAAYTYDAFGRTVTATGPLADTFPHRFSTKYFDPETCLYYYGYRFYSPELMRWINRDTIEEEGGSNLYCFCENTPPTTVDFLGDKPICDCITVDIRVFWRDNWSSISHANYPFVSISGGEKIPYSKNNSKFPRFKDNLSYVEVLVIPDDIDKCHCDGSGDFHWPLVRISTPTTTKEQNPWSEGTTADGKRFINHHVTETLMPRFKSGTLRSVTVEVVSRASTDILCKKTTFYVQY